MASTDHRVRDNPARHRFEIDLGDGSVAIADYNLLDGRIMFTSTLRRMQWMK